MVGFGFFRPIMSIVASRAPPPLDYGTQDLSSDGVRKKRYSQKWATKRNSHLPH